MNSRIRVAIVGGGIGGLAAATALVGRGIDVAVFEQAGTLGEIGAGIMIYPNSIRLLERSGLSAKLAAYGARLGPGSCYRRMDGAIVGPVLVSDTSGAFGCYGFHRADMLKLLAETLPADVVHTGHRCIAVSQNENCAKLQFANGTTFEADLVVAADGIHSALQRSVTDRLPPEYSGSRAYRGLVNRRNVPDWPADSFQVWMGERKHFMVFPVRGGDLLNYVAFVPTAEETLESWSAVGDREELIRSFQGWDPPVTRLLEQVETCFWWGLYDRRPLTRWTHDRIALLGDAAHAMLPHLGQGANQAVEDGYCLAYFLAGRARNEVAEAVQRYAGFRRMRTDIIQAESRRNGLRYDSRYLNLEMRDQEIRSSIEFRKWLYDYDVERAAARAQRNVI